MKGYYTVKLIGGDLSPGDRLASEIRYVKALEQQMGGHEATATWLLGAAGDEAAREGVRSVCAAVERQVWGGPLPNGIHFTLRAFTAIDL